ncbi:hypothetical protein VNO80_28092 [Phaseolus coccineus]|uniref:Uncharacterized protein n=1 Tax=Phaseolus coccineus TaxID=3886 RepID=A0AAN9QHT7_PHACN
MALHALKFQTHKFIRSMCDNGLVNKQFVNLEAAREHPLRRDALVRAITAYSSPPKAKSLFSDITIQL